MKILCVTILLLLSHFAQSATLTAGYKSVGIKLGSASVGHEDYTIVGASLHYFAVDNLALGGAYEYWFSGDPSISKASLESTYYIPVHDQIKPYLGLLYSHYFIDDHHDVDTYGYRAGVAYVKSPMLISAGIRSEKTISDSARYVDEDPTFELVVGLSF
jgi:hypothetical protein